MADERLCNPISTPELERRWAAVRAAMPEQKLDALIIQGANNLAGTGGYFRWFTGVSMGTSYPATVIFPADGLMTLVSHGPMGVERDFAGQRSGLARRRPMAADRELPGDRLLHPLRCRARSRREIKKAGYRNVGIVGWNNMLFGFGDTLRKLLDGVTLSDATRLVDPLKAKKSAEEIELIRMAGQMQDEILAKVAGPDQGRQEGLRAAGLRRLRRQPARQRDRLHAGLVGAARPADPDQGPPRAGPHHARRRRHLLPVREHRPGGMMTHVAPPIDRLAVRTFVSPFDGIVVREALLRERYRGGQAFYVCPRIEDLADAKAFLDKHVPEVRVAVAHGQMPSTVLEDIMSAFYDGKFDVLLSTTIIESGLDIPTANTLIVHRADMFGLSQIYQLRGRVGRAKLRAYALLTLPAKRRITAQAERRLKVLQSLDTLGAGFQLASHDLDIRGAGNLLGEEQSGHIKEVGYELYQQMLEEAVLSLKAGISTVVADRWSPQITIGTAVLIPEEYVTDLPVRLALYRRLAEIEDERDIESFAAELVDRFGPLPQEVEYLLQVVAIKSLCRRANVERIEVGPKGAVLAFRENIFSNPEGLIAYIGKHPEGARVRPDMKVVFFDEWETAPERLKGATGILRTLVGIGEKGVKAA